MKKTSSKVNLTNYLSQHFIYYASAIAFVLLFIVVFRAFNTGITYDEAYTYVNYVEQNPFDVFDVMVNKDNILANNHVLNSFLISIVDSITTIRYNEFLIRFPNILFYVLYIWFSIKLVKDFQHKYLAFNILVFNYGVHEFFGLARGYGISAALTLIGVYYLYKWLNKGDYKDLNICYYYLLLSCYANTIALIGFASIIIFSQLYILIYHGIKENFVYLKSQLLKILLIIPLLVIIIQYHFKISSEGLPLYGGKENFFNSVIISSLNLFGFNELMQLLATIVFLAGIVLMIVLKRKELIKFDSHYLIIIYMILLIILTKITGKIWITGRELIPMYPILAFSLFNIIEKFSIKNIYLEICIAVIISIPFLLNINVSKTRQWSDNYFVKDKVYKALVNDEKNVIFTKDEYTYAIDFYERKIIYSYGKDKLKFIYERK